MGCFPRKKLSRSLSSGDRAAAIRTQSSAFRPSADKWELNAEFFTALSQWTLDHPDSTLDQIIQRISQAIDAGRDFIDLIPDTPFPARSLVKSVAQLIQLSAIISHSQDAVRDFALRIIQWVNRVRESFIEAGNGRFTTRTWDNLVIMRTLIDEICDWAAERLKDGRWNVSNRKIEGEIRDFQLRLDETEKLFNVRSLIVISGGLDAILQFLSAIFISQYILINTLDRLHRTQEEHVKRILEDQQRQRFIDENLRPFTLQDPTYITQNKKPCDPDTRMEILDQIRAWIQDHSKASSKNFLWLVGPPGCGKSAITASITRECKSCGTLGAQFFINRSNHNTTNPNLFFPTVARAVSKRSDSVEQHLYDVLRRSTYSVDTPHEAAKLFVDIVGKAASSNPDTPVVIIFDGLDETSRDRLEDTATIFSHLFTSLRKYPNAKLLISSRPEDEILRSFNRTPDKEFIVELLCNTDDPNCRRDVEVFLKRRLIQIADRRGFSSLGWPSDNDIAKLADRASGLFIWAVTASNYINTRLRLSGKEVLKTVFNQFDSKAMKEINTLYLTILNFSYPEEIDDPWMFETFRRLIGAIMVLREPLNIRNLDALLDFRKTPDSDLVDVRNFVEHLRTLLVTDLDDVTQDTIPQVHKSFIDYITSTGGHTPDRFRVDIEASNAEMTVLCLRHLTIAYSDAHDTQYASKESDLKALSVPVRYSLRFVLSHMPEGQGTTLGVLSDLPDVVNPSQLDVLLRRSSHLCSIKPLVFSVPSNHTFVRTSFEKASLIWSPEDGSATMAISMIVPRDYQWFEFSPSGTRIFIHTLDGFACTPEDSYDLSQGLLLLPRSEMPNDCQILDFSDDGTRIVYATGFKTILLHSISPNFHRSEISNRNKTKILNLRMSQNCTYIATRSGKNDTVIDIWDISNGCYINLADSMRHEAFVICMAFSPDATLLISCDDQHAYIWDIPLCKRKYSFPFSPGGRDSVAFSPDSQTIIAGSDKGAVFLWNPHTGEQIGKRWNIPSKSSDKRVHHVAFRSCGNIALASCDDSLFLWNVCQSTLITVIPNIFPGAVFTSDGSQLLYREDFFGPLGVRNLAPLLLDMESTFKPKWTSFSPGGNLVVSVATDRILCWRLDAIKVVGNPLESGATYITTVAFSADETLITGAGENGTLYLWNSASRKLLSSLPDSVQEVSSLSFSSDSAHILAELRDGELVVLTIKDGILSVSNDYERIHALQNVETAYKSTFFDLDKSPVTFGTDLAAPNRRLKDVHWYPSRSNSVVWAYVNNHIIRAGKDGSFVVLPVDVPVTS